MESFRSVQLLESAADPGYPLEYLLSRVRGRRSRLVKDWKQAAYDVSLPENLASSRAGDQLVERSPEALWRNLLREHRWLFGQMNTALRSAFAPYFLYAELRTLFIGLRHIRDRKTEAAADLLSVSLLAAEVKNILLASETLEYAVERLGGFLRSRSVDPGDLEGLLETDGLRGVEQRVTERILAALMAERLDAAVREFFRRLIDARNVLSLFKAIRLGTSRPPQEIGGGSLSAGRFQSVLQSQDLSRVALLMHEATGARTETVDIPSVEMTLYRGITRYLKEQGREPLGKELLLDYLWKRSVETINLSILVQCRELDRETVQAELVY